VAAPTAANSPKVGIDVTGNGIVAFQEPDDGFVDRVWARRIFGSALGIPLIVSPQDYGGAPLRGAADAFTVDEAGFGEAAVAFRQQAGERSALNGSHVFVNTIPEAFSPDAGKFATARIVDGPAGRALGAAPSVPSVGVTPHGTFLVTFGAGTATFAASGDDTSVAPLERLDDARGGVEGTPVAELADSDAAVAAWRVRRSAVAVQERALDGRFAVKSLAGRAGGDVGTVAVSGSGLGDAVVAFEQGVPGSKQVVVGAVDAPPLQFAVQTPVSWVRSKRVRLTWDPAPHAAALGAVTYAVIYRDEELAEGLRRKSFRLRTGAVGDGRHELLVIARDSAGQETESLPAELKIDRRPPVARVRHVRKGRGVQVRIRDGRRRRASGAKRAGTVISFGDGRRARRRLRVRHVYSRPGTYRLVIKARDRAGNRLVAKRRVRVR
jgi:hypothetical protein